MAFIINVDYTAINLALTPVMTELHSNLNSMQWVLSGYVLAWSIFVIPAGKYADYYGKKRLCLIGIALFLLASLIAGCAMSPGILILARVFQGVAAAIYVPTLYALIYLNFAENERGKAIGLMSLAVGLGMAIGPLMGGLFVSWFSWRYIFFVNIPIGLIALFIIYKSKSAELLQASITKISKRSLILLSLIIVIILYSLSQWQLWPTHGFLYSGLALVALLAFVYFVLLQQKISNPLIPLKLFSNVAFLGCIIGIFIEQYGFSSIIIATGMYLQKILQLSALKCSAIYLSLTALFGIVAVIGGRWVDRVGIRLPTVLGLTIMAIGSAIFMSLTANSSLAFVCMVFSILGIGMGLAFSGLNTGIVKTVSEVNIGIASSTFLMFALLGNSFGVTLTTMIYERASHIGAQIITETIAALNTGVSNAMLVTFLFSIFGIFFCTALIKKLQV
jgi:EmrB/QacA subfamily drug resistance transporter